MSKKLELPEQISVRLLAEKLEVAPTELIAKLISGGVMASINQNLDFETAALVAEEFGFELERESTPERASHGSVQSKNALKRPPVVTVMGHVDHGKTSLLDRIRQSDVAKSESGGITQHISAYQIEFIAKDKKKRLITFIDTPGHEAFSALRAHGASLTDLVVLVVAADDGVKPQTVEAIKFARASGAQIIVAVNKIDLPGANLERVKQQLAENDLTPEDWGGKTVVVPISAKTGEGTETLLEMVVLLAELQDLKADPDATPEGIIIEAHLDKQVGPVASVLVYSGTLRMGQVAVVGKTYGRIRQILDDEDRPLASAGPSMPVTITGLKDVPDFGETLRVVPNEKVAKSMTGSAKTVRTHVGSESENTLNIVLKADVGGSLAALEESIRKLKAKDALVEIVSSGIGAVNENDLNLSESSGALIISFRSSPNKRIQTLAERSGIEIKESWVIYEVLDYLKEKLVKIATPTYKTVELGRLKVLATFSRKKDNAIVGGKVTSGAIEPDAQVVIRRDKDEIGTAALETVKVGKEEVKSVDEGNECGLSLSKITEGVQVEEGDVLIVTKTIRED